MRNTKGRLHIVEKVGIAFVLVLSPGYLVAQNWEQYTNSEMDSLEGIEIYYRYIQVDGFDYLEFKGSTLIQSPLTSLVAVLRDVQDMPNWVYNVESAKLMVINPMERYTYFVHKSIGIFFKPRDSYVYSILNQDSITLDVSIKGNSKPDKVERSDQYVRIEKGESQWVFIPVNKNTSKVIFQGYANPGGWISSSLLTPLAKSELWKLPYYTLKELKTHITAEKYQNASYSFIRNY